MFKTVAEALEILRKDETITDVLNTIGATITSLTNADLSLNMAFLIAVVLKEAEKRINQIAQSKQ